jgi:hypothetical protein
MFHNSIGLLQGYCLHGWPKRRELTCFLQIAEKSLLPDMQGVRKVCRVAIE